MEEEEDADDNVRPDLVSVVGNEAQGGLKVDSEDSASERLARAEREVAELREKLDEKDRQLRALKAENTRLRGKGKDRLAKCGWAYDDLKALDGLKSDFLALVSHELRTPLTAVLGYTDLALKGMGGTLTPKQERYLTTALANAKELLRLINSLIEFSILEAGRDDAQPARVSLPNMVELALSPLRSMAIDKGVELRNEVLSTLPPVKADEPKLRRALESVLCNAIKFTPPGGVVILGASLSADRVVISVEDTGIGMPPEELDRIWEKFYQVDSSATRRFGGLGLGLAIAKKLVEMQGGQMWAKSEGPDQGATFKIELPRWEE